MAVARGNEKGRVERAVRFIRDAFFAGRRFTDVDDLNAQADAWVIVPAGFLSLCGGALSLAVMLVLLQLPVSGYIFCAGSALAHNLGQLAGAAVLLSSAMALGYAPVLLAAGLIVGGISCTLSRALFAALPKQAGQQRRGSPFQK